MSEQQALRSIDKLGKEREEIRRLLESNEAEKQENRFSAVTLEQHFDTFLHTYVPTRGRKGEVQEDNLDCPLVERAGTAVS